MKNRTLILIAIALTILCAAFIAAQGSSYVVKLDVSGVSDDAGDFSVAIDQSTDSVTLADKHLEDSTLYMEFRSAGEGRALVDVDGPDGYTAFFRLYSHKSGILTFNDYLGDCTGSRIIPFAISM